MDVNLSKKNILLVGRYLYILTLLLAFYFSSRNYTYYKDTQLHSVLWCLGMNCNGLAGLGSWLVGWFFVGCNYVLRCLTCWGR